MDGKTDSLTESQFLVKLRLEHGPGDSVSGPEVVAVRGS